MTLYETLNVSVGFLAAFIALLSLVLAAWALVRTRRLDQQQSRLQDKQEELIDLQLESLRRERHSIGTVLPPRNEPPADVRVRLQGPARQARFMIENWGEGAARSVNLTAKSKANGESPFVRGDYDQKLPILELLAGDRVALLAALTLASGVTFDVVVTWRDQNDQQRQREQQVSLV